MKLKTYFTFYICSDEPHVSAEQHRSRQDAIDYIKESTKEAFRHNPSAFMSEPDELYDDVFYINDMDYYQIQELIVDTGKGYPA